MRTLVLEVSLEHFDHTLHGLGECRVLRPLPRGFTLSILSQHQGVSPHTRTRNTLSTAPRCSNCGTRDYSVARLYARRKGFRSSDSGSYGFNHSEAKFEQDIVFQVEVVVVVP